MGKAKKKKVISKKRKVLKGRGPFDRDNLPSEQKFAPSEYEKVTGKKRKVVDAIHPVGERDVFSKGSQRYISSRFRYNFNNPLNALNPVFADDNFQRNQTASQMAHKSNMIKQIPSARAQLAIPKSDMAFKRKTGEKVYIPSDLRNHIMKFL